MKWMKMAILAVSVLLCFSAVPVLAQPSLDQGDTGGSSNSGIWGACDDTATDSNTICGDDTEAIDIVKRIINVLLYIIGILSVVMIIFSGLKYVNSRGDAESIKSAKNTLLYAVVGLVVAMLAFTIVNFVVGRF